MSFPDWSNKTIEEAFDLNVKFIKGEIKESCYHDRPICHEISPSLLELNKKYRIFTCDGQEGCKESGKLGHHWQMPYLSFMIGLMDQNVLSSSRMMKDMS